MVNVTSVKNIDEDEESERRGSAGRADRRNGWVVLVVSVVALLAFVAGVIATFWCCSRTRGRNEPSDSVDSQRPPTPITTESILFLQNERPLNRTTICNELPRFLKSMMMEWTVSARDALNFSLVSRQYHRALVGAALGRVQGLKIVVAEENMLNVRKTFDAWKVKSSDAESDDPTEEVALVADMRAMATSKDFSSDSTNDHSPINATILVPKNKCE